MGSKNRALARRKERVEGQKIESEIERLRAENAKLRSALYQAYLRQHGSAAGSDAIARLADEHRQILEHEVEYLRTRNRQLESILPMDIIDPEGIPRDDIRRTEREDNGRWKATAVGITLFCRDGDAPEDYRSVIVTGTYPGDREAAVYELGGRLAEIALPMPTRDDMAVRPKGFEALTSEDMTDILTELTETMLFDEEAYRSRRLELFHERVWPKLDANYDYTRDEARGKFMKWLDHSLERYNERRRRYGLIGIRLLSGAQ